MYKYIFFLAYFHLLIPSGLFSRSTTYNYLSGLQPERNLDPCSIGLTSFSAKICTQNACLEWTTYSEINNDYFTVEKSIDGISFVPVSYVDGAGNSLIVNQYSIIDTQLFEGTIYYRLKQTDFNGSFTYSKLVALEFSKTPEFYFLIYPNPASGNEFNLKIFGAKGSEVKIIINDFTGKESYSALVTLTENGENIYSLCSNAPSGTYFVTIISEKAKSIKKMIVQ
jgi:hypothetical protein